MARTVPTCFERHERLESALLASTDAAVNAHVAAPLRVYGAIRAALEDQRRARPAAPGEAEARAQRLRAAADAYLTRLEDRVESLLMGLYREGLPSLDRQLGAEQAVQRMQSTGPSSGATSRRMRRASVAPHLQQYGANTKPLPGFESHKANRGSLARMARATGCLRAIVAAVRALVQAHVTPRGSLLC